MLFCQKDFGVSEELILVLRWQAVEDGEVLLEDRAPFGRGRRRPQARAAAGFEEVEHHLLRLIRCRSPNASPCYPLVSSRFPLRSSRFPLPAPSRAYFGFRRLL